MAGMLRSAPRNLMKDIFGSVKNQLIRMFFLRNIRNGKDAENVFSGKRLVKSVFLKAVGFADQPAEAVTVVRSFEVFFGNRKNYLRGERCVFRGELPDSL